MINQNVEFFNNLGFEVDMFFFENKSIPKINKVRNIFQFPRPGLGGIVKSFYSGKKFSFQERLFYSDKAKEFISQLLQENSYEVVVVDMVRMSYLVEDIDVKKILEYDDLLSMRYERMLADFNNNIDLLGTYTEKFPPFISKLIKPFRKIVLKKESELISVRELELSEKYNAITFTSPVEAEKFSTESGRSDVYFNPPAISLDKSNISRIDSVNQASFFIVGNMKANHNLATLQVIADIFRRSDIKGKNITISIYGEYDNRAQEMCTGLDNIILNGIISDISDIFKKHNCLIAPIPFGSGIKVKVIEAMSYGALVITNNIGAEGIGIQHNINFLSCNTLDEFALSIISVHDDYAKHLAIASKGSEYVRDNFSKKVVKQNIKNIFEHIGINN